MGFVGAFDDAGPSCLPLAVQEGQQSAAVLLLLLRRRRLLLLLVVVQQSAVASAGPRHDWAKA